VGTFKLGLVVTCQVNGSSPFNVPDMFPPVSRGPHPQCEQPTSVMMHGTKSLENDRCTFGGSDRTPCRGVEAVTDFAGVAIVDEMLTYIRDQSIWGICKEEPRRRTRDPFEPAEYSRLSATSSSSSSSVSSIGSFSLLAVLVADVWQWL